MNWQIQLITIYLMVCKHYESHLWTYCQRVNNHTDLSFSDEEAITLYIFGVIEKSRGIKQIYTHADRHLRQWFPRLPSYVAFVQRLNKLSGVFAPLLEIIQSEQETKPLHSALLVDSFPVVLAKQGHRFKACVAKKFADHSYCSTKKLYFYGARVHVVGRRQAGILPTPEYIALTPASENDDKVFDQIRPELISEEIYGDKLYHRPDAQEIQTQLGLTVFTPVKKQKGQAYLEADQQWLSTAVSQVRQPIEALFGWIEAKTGIECAGKVRSLQRLMVHVFGRLTVAMYFWNYLRVSS